MVKRKKLQIIFILIITSIIIGAIVYSRTVCDEKWSKINSKLNSINKINSVERIILSKTFPGFDINLVSDTILIQNDQIIEAIRQSIIERKKSNWNRATPEWFVNITIVLCNGDELPIRASKINKDTTHLFFGDKDCMDHEFTYSTTLNALLEGISSSRH